MTKPVGYLTNSVTGIEGEPGVFYSYILAAGGVYLRAQNAQLAATVCIAPCEIRGVAPLNEDIQFLKGKIPLHLLNLALSVLIAKPDIEMYLAITWDGIYSLGDRQRTSESAAIGSNRNSRQSSAWEFDVYVPAP